MSLQSQLTRLQANVASVSGTTEVIATSDLNRLTSLVNAFMECDELTWTPDFDVQDGADCSGAF